MSDSLNGKQCRGCLKVLGPDSFAADRNRPDGLQTRCRACVAEYCAARYRARRGAEGKVVREKADVPDGHKLCRTCGEVEPHGEWHRRESAPDGLAARCKACRKPFDRAGHLKRKCGITEAERDEMIAARGGVCLICLKAPAVHVDHCHKTGRVRGVLCFNCNTGLGLLKEDPDRARRAAEYLEGHAWKPTIVAQGVYRQPS
ncbi:endonuclease VII domain-containing protein [Streptomyces sp. NPDC051567]|uniref:endonuclease VII domain-containing protein n=1 Tax=Streptomyces sp. NPDC051567 TaxID=3365660 RepID=UPI0037AB54D2